MTLTLVGSLPVSALAEDTVAWIAPDATLREIAQQLSDHDVGVLAVGDGDVVDGVVSERDVARALAGDAPAPVARSLAHPPLFCDATAPVAEAAAEMMANYVRHLLLERGGEVVGIVSARDLLGVYAAMEVFDDADDESVGDSEDDGDSAT